MQELLNLITEINDKTNYTASFRYMPHKINGSQIDNYAVDLTLNDDNVFHIHKHDFNYIPEVIEQIKNKLNTKTTYWVKFSDGSLSLNYKAESLEDAKEHQAKYLMEYGIKAEIVEVIDGN